MPDVLMPPFDGSWTLFLDRDGVINEHRPGYISRWCDFEFAPAAVASISRLCRIFGQTLVVTNQQGIGKGLMTAGELEHIFNKMDAAIRRAGGKVDGYYYCPHRAEEGCICRKPASGMALQAKSDFPEIDFGKSVMVGDQASDLKFGKDLGMTTVHISKEVGTAGHPLADYRFALLDEFARWVVPA